MFCKRIYFSKAEQNFTPVSCIKFSANSKIGKNVWAEVAPWFFLTLLINGVCSYIVHILLMGPSWHLHDFFITCPSLVYFLYMTWSWLVHDLFVTCLWLVNDLFMACSRLAHNLHGDSWYCLTFIHTHPYHTIYFSIAQYWPLWTNIFQNIVGERSR